MKDREKKTVSVYILVFQFKEFVDIVDDMIREIHQREGENRNVSSKI